MKGNKTSLLLGASGFIGSHLSNYLASKGEHVIGTYCHPRGRLGQNRLPCAQPRVVRLDVTEAKMIEQTIRRVQPDHIYYLAAQSSVRDAWLKPVETIQVNLLGGVHLLESLRKLNSKARVLIFSSGTTYGSSHASGKSLREDACLNPKDPYSVSKTAIDILGRLYAHAYGMNVLVVRLANLVGPGQSTLFSIANFASQIAAAEMNPGVPVIQVGNLSTRRDYLDIRDGVAALYLAMKYGTVGEPYHIASGVSRTLRSVLFELIGLSKLKRNSVKIVKTDRLIPKDEIKTIRLNSSKFRRLTGWRPRVPFHETLADLLNEWRKKCFCSFP